MMGLLLSLWILGCIATLLLFLSTWLTVIMHPLNPQRKTKQLRLPQVIGPLLIAWKLDRLHDAITFCMKRYKGIKVAYPGFDYYVTVDPINVEHMLKTNFQNYVKGNSVYEKQEEFLGDGIFSVDGPEWKHQRKAASYEFRSKALRDFCNLAFRSQACKLAQFLICEARTGRPVDLQDAALRLTFDSYCRIGFGLEINTLQQNPLLEQLSFAQAFDDCNAHVFLRFVDPLWKLKRWMRVASEAKFLRDVATIDRVLLGLIEQKRRRMQQDAEETVQSDLLSRFFALAESESEVYTDKKLRDIVLNFLIAARDTTALTLCWFLHRLCQNRRIQEKLVQEICQLEPESGVTALSAGDYSDGGNSFPSDEQVSSFANLLSYDKLNKLHYLQACLQETLRLHPPVPLDTRTAVAEDIFPDGTKVRRGDMVSLSAYAMGRMKQLWGEDARSFNPERFIRDGVCQQESPFKLPAFVGGPRMCLGKDFAFLQMKVTAAVLLRFLKFEVVSGHKVQYRMMLTLHMSKDGLKVNVFPRLRNKWHLKQMA